MANVDLLSELKKNAELRRVLLNEKINKVEDKVLEKGDYVGFWKGPIGNGRGKVLYQGKTYEALMISSASLPMNKKVKLTIAEKDYYVSW